MAGKLQFVGQATVSYIRAIKVRSEFVKDILANVDTLKAAGGVFISNEEWAAYNRRTDGTVAKTVLAVGPTNALHTKAMVKRGLKFGTTRRAEVDGKQGFYTPLEQ